MKISQKLLGLAGVALADYACCPYDDYGLPDPTCVGELREKTPFAGSNFQQNDCKAWEFNADATFDGSDACGVDYGQCGFQRQFAWGGHSDGSVQSPTNTAILGIASSWTLSFGSSGTASTDAAWDATTVTKVTADTYPGTMTPDTRTEAKGWGIGNAPKLGAMCKLFVPVSPANIVQVQVAGVHKQGANLASFPAQFTHATSQTPVDGTVYCFSVVNPSEGDVNSNGVANGNVNGRGTGTQTDDFASSTSLERQAGLSPVKDWNAYLVGSAATTIDGANDLNNSNGANFDVVAHFSSAWCARGAVVNGAAGKVVEMQQAGDANYNDNDYDLTSNHAHNDIIEKRFAAATYGAYTASGGYMTNAGTSLGGLRWPNQGAWAGYHSVVTCAVTSSAAGNNAWSGNRDYMLSVGSNDFRQGSAGACTGLKYRFNVRQIGDKVANCGPGQLPDEDTKRCTWNWNYSANTASGTTDNDPEDFFDRTDNMIFDTWADNTGRKRRAVGDGAYVAHDAAVPNTAATSQANVADVVFTFAFKDYAGNAITPTALDADNSKYFSTTTTTATVSCNTSGSTPYRDNFPDCFFGDEIHLTATYTGNANARVRISPWFSTVST